MAAPKTLTRNRIVESALYLFWLRGYAATTVAEILERAAANPGSFYFLFKTKEDLLLAVLDLYIQTLNSVVINPVLEKIQDPVDRVFGVLDFYRQNLIKTDCTYGCPIGRLALEIPEEQSRIQRRIADNFDGWTAAIEKCLEDARPRLPEATDLKSLSKFVLTTMEGGVMQSRAHKSIEPFEASYQHLRGYFHFLEAERARVDALDKARRKESSLEIKSLRDGKNKLKEKQ
jgi:TetR/AcrR family transcriptional regulator, transcriptional repressor for nem operon